MTKRVRSRLILYGWNYTDKALPAEVRVLICESVYYMEHGKYFSLPSRRGKQTVRVGYQKCDIIVKNCSSSIDMNDLQAIVHCGGLFSIDINALRAIAYCGDHFLLI